MVTQVGFPTITLCFLCSLYSSRLLFASFLENLYCRWSLVWIITPPQKKKKLYWSCENCISITLHSVPNKCSVLNYWLRCFLGPNYCLTSSSFENEATTWQFPINERGCGQSGMPIVTSHKDCVSQHKLAEKVWQAKDLKNRLVSVLIYSLPVLLLESILWINCK